MLQAAKVALVVGLLAAACGGTTTETSTDAPTVSITSLTASGSVGSVQFTASARGEPVDVQIDWGDSSQPTAFRGQGVLSAEHTYPADVTSVTVTVTVTDDQGNSTRQGSALTLAPAGGEPVPTASPDPGITPTPPPAPTATPTPAPPGPPTATPPPSPSPTATPPAETVIQLALTDADVDGSATSGDGTYGRDGLAAVVATSTIGVDETDAAEVRATWIIPAAELEPFGPNPQVSVFFELNATGELDTETTVGVWEGMAAGLYLRLEGTYGGASLGRGEDLYSIGPDERLVLSDQAVTLGFGSPAEGSLADLEIVFTARCDVSSATDLLGGLGRSSCDFGTGGNRIGFAVARVTLGPA